MAEPNQFQNIRCLRLRSPPNHLPRNSIVLTLPSFNTNPGSENLAEYVANIFHILLTRLQKSRTERFVFRFVELIYFLAAVEKQGLGPTFVEAALEQQGQGLFGQLLQMFIIPKTPQIKGRDQIIITIVGATRFLTESRSLQSGQDARFWYLSHLHLRWSLTLGRRC